MSSWFIEEEDDDDLDMVVGENGALAYSDEAVGYPLIPFFFALVRGCNRVDTLLNQCLRKAEFSPEMGPMIISDLFILAFQTRDCRGGKGERKLFFDFIKGLYAYYPETTMQLLPLLSDYGYYKDYLGLIETLSQETPLVERICDIFANQLIADETALDQWYAETKDMHENKPPLSLSLCAKYAPREGKHFETTYPKVFKLLLQKLNKNKAKYRKFVTKLSEALDIPEIKMCKRSFAEIDFNKVPSLCLKKYKKAFLNEKVGATPPMSGESETGNRYPDNEDRVLCRKHLLEAMKKGPGVIKGKQLFPHDLVKSCMNGCNISESEYELIECQWSDIRKNISETLAARSDEVGSSIHLGRLVPLVDVSGSMSGTPMEVAIALGILVSELNHPAFRDRFITFETNPSWVDFSNCTSLKEKVSKSVEAPWGGSTDIEKAFKLIEEVIRKHNLPKEEIPALIIFSDMQFNSAVGSKGSTQLANIEKRFARLGVELTGSPFPAPMIIYWNLRDAAKGTPAKGDTPNVQLLSGFSPSLFKAICDGDFKPEEEITPEQTLRNILDDERYHPIKKILHQSQEKVLASYTFINE